MNHHEYNVLKNLLLIVDQDLMPNIGKIAVQDYQRLNETLMLGRKLVDEQDAHVVEAFDVYKAFAASMYSKSPNDVTKDERQAAKSKLLAAGYRPHHVDFDEPWKYLTQLVDLHTDKLRESEYTYFELAYTRHTGWMAWLCSKPSSQDPDHKVFACGQAETPEDACYNAMQDYAERQKKEASDAVQR